MLQDHGIVIIGGTTGMGLAGVRACVEAGAKVVAVGLDEESCQALSSQAGDSIVVLQADATQSQTAEKAVTLAQSEFGHMDGLYHVAGGSGRKWGDGALHEISDDAWDKTFQLNLTSLFYSNRAAVRHWLHQKSPGSILNLGSVTAFHPSPIYFATHAYAAAKASILGFSASCASYYAPHQIRFNVITPALTETPMSQRAVQNQAILQYIQTKQPLDGGRVGQPEDLDGAVTFFLSRKSKFVTGQVLAVDGGWSMSEGQYPIPHSP